MIFWTDNDHDVINKLFIELYKSDLYKNIYQVKINLLILIRDFY